VPAIFWYPLLALTAALAFPVIALGFFGTRGKRFAGFVERESSFISWVNNVIGVTVAWAVLFMVLMQFAVVLLRYVFGYNSIAMQESVVYAHATVFMIGSAYTLLVGGHVRVDIFYHSMRDPAKSWVDLVGTLLFLVPFMLLILNFSWNYVEIAWRIHETSREASGLPYVYLLKSVIIGFAVLMLLEGIAVAGRAALVISGFAEHPVEQRAP